MERPWVGLSGLVGWYRGVRDVLSYQKTLHPQCVPSVKRV